MSGRVQHPGKDYPFQMVNRTFPVLDIVHAILVDIESLIRYLRVSTNPQTVENQRLELDKYCERQGWAIAKVYEDIHAPDWHGDAPPRHGHTCMEIS